MPKLIYTALMSLDGYNADADGSFRWAAPDEEVHEFVNELSRPVGTLLLGRRMHEVLGVWDTMDCSEEPESMRDFQAIWRATDKVVFSRTRSELLAPRTRLEREFDPALVRELKATAVRDLGIGGPVLAAHALHAGLVDELQLVISPVVVGGGNRVLPDGLHLELELQAERQFGNGTVYVQYGVRG
ncbi:MAG: dihydrofolate reductase family protein [Patulibacter minatonensis]